MHVRIVVRTAVVKAIVERHLGLTPQDLAVAVLQAARQEVRVAVRAVAAAAARRRVGARVLAPAAAQGCI